MNQKQTPNLHLDWIDPDAIEIVDILQRKGFTTYLVGGCVRDLLVGIHPKDFDIATTAHPKDVKRYIPQSYIIGKRFRLVLVRRGARQFEVATFRKGSTPEAVDTESDAEPAPSAPQSPTLGDNVFGTPIEDASRRDFRINSLFYDPIGNELIDYSTGLTDIRERTLRMIGDPFVRLVEDPIRILRAIRLAHKIGFTIDVEMKAAIVANAHTVALSVLPRRREEILKMLRLPAPDLAFQEAFDLGVLQHLSPDLAAIYSNADSADIFSGYLRFLANWFWDLESPVDLFGLVVLGYVRAQASNGENPSINANRFLEDPKINNFLRNQLGLFKYEQGQVARALQICHALEKTDKFKKQGERRQMALLKNDSFPLALKMARCDFLLSGQDLQFWSDAYNRALPAIMKSSSERKARPPRRSSRKAKARNLGSATRSN